MRVPRSQLYARALEAYVKDHSGEEITQRLNDVYSKVTSRLEPASEAISSPEWSLT